MKKFSKNLLEIIILPLDEVKKYGDILTISEKIGGFIFRYLFGVPIKYVFLPLLAIFLLILVSFFSLFIGEEENTNKELIDLSKSSFKIKDIVYLSQENIPQGVKEDIFFFFRINDSFTQDLLTERYKNTRKKYHPDALVGDREKWEECHKLYDEMIWHWFKSPDEKLTCNYPKLRAKSYRHKPRFGVKSLVNFDNKTGRVVQTSSFDGDKYLIVNDSNGEYYEVFEEDMTSV